MLQSAITALIQAGIRVEEHARMAEHTTFRIGGPVRALVFPNGEEEFSAVLQVLQAHRIQPLLIGNGSNLLASDRLIEKIAVKTQDVAERKLLTPTSIYASCGVLLSRVATFALEHSLTGLEFAHGIPGTVGGAVFMNAGAYGGEMAQVVSCVHVLDENNVRRVIPGEDAKFSYRYSRFMDTGERIIGAELALSPGDAEEIAAQMQDLAARRRNSQPLTLPSAGSAFKRPKDGYAAAMIEAAGLKGYADGGAMVSDKHAGFVVNHANATCDDVLRLMRHVQAVVYEQTGTMLEPEVMHID